MSLKYDHLNREPFYYVLPVQYRHIFMDVFLSHMVSLQLT